ncbi:MAG: hypothetical protein PVI23_02465 [Maricaulaceae bacterium]|jgi:hypothetical protein
MRARSLLFFVLTPLIAGAACDQSVGETSGQVEPEVSSVFDPAYVAQAQMFEEIAAIDASAEMQAARDAFERTLRMRAEMSMAEMMAAMSMESGMMMPGPYDAQETAVSAGMIEALESRPSPAAVRSAYDDSPLPDRAVEVIQSGHGFESRVYEILSDGSIDDKAAALAAAVEAYLSEDLTVPAQPMPAELLLEHPHAGAFSDGYPKLSRVLWSAQWLQLATIEALLNDAQQPSGGVATVNERFQNKISNGDQSGSPAPVELPMAPAIAPTLFSLSPDTAIVLDNLNMFEAVVADIMSYPNLEGRDALINALADRFTSRDEDFATTYDYVVSSLRGGIYNQGGPAIGQLARSERNRSRSEMGMEHAMVMSVP